jgi:hypothetical protein
MTADGGGGVSLPTVEAPNPPLPRTGAPDLAPPLCLRDYAVNGYLPAGATFTRSHVPAEGAPSCDFRYPTPALSDAPTRSGTTKSRPGVVFRPCR